MSKRSDFIRIERDHYPTPLKPVLALAPHLSDVTGFAEPFVGEGVLLGHLESLGHPCRFASDIVPGVEVELSHAAKVLDWQAVTEKHLAGCSHVVSNPPWPAPRAKGEPTLSIIRHLSAIRPTWLLLSADFAHNVYAPGVMAYCHKIVSVVRVRWIEGSDHDGKDNAAWYLFDQNEPRDVGTLFHPIGERRPVYARAIEEMLG